MSKPKKVVFILPSYSAGGAERVLINLMNAIDRRQFSPEFICFRRNGALKNLIAKDIPIHTLGSYKKIYFGIVPLYLRLKKIKPDVVVATMAHTNFLLLLLRPLLLKTRIVVREAITPSFIFDTKKYGWFVKLLYKTLYPLANIVISPSQKIIDEFDEILHANIGHHAILYNPVNIDLLRVGSPMTLQNLDRADTVHFIAAGRMHRQKGFDQLIEALSTFECDYNWRFTIWGAGHERTKLGALIKQHGLHDNIFLPGFTKEPWPYIAGADCFLMPSRFEGLPNAVLESLAVGTPVIATSTSGGIQEIADFANSDDVRIAQHMKEFLDLMKDVKPLPTNAYRDSLLPQQFSMQAAINRFTHILNASDEFEPTIKGRDI